MFTTAWLAGLLVATGVLVIIKLVASNPFESLGGSVISGTLAFFAGTGAAALIEVKRRQRHAEIIALYLLVLAVVYNFILPTITWYLTAATGDVRRQ
jgi:hypothetical protein